MSTDTPQTAKQLADLREAQKIECLADLRRELAHPIMQHTGIGEVQADLLSRAAGEIERLRRIEVAAQAVIAWGWVPDDEAGTDDHADLMLALHYALYPKEHP